MYAYRGQTCFTSRPLHHIHTRSRIFILKLCNEQVFRFSQRHVLLAKTNIVSSQRSQIAIKTAVCAVCYTSPENLHCIVKDNFSLNFCLKASFRAQTISQVLCWIIAELSYARVFRLMQ